MYGISLLSLIPLRKEPAEQSEMVSQLLFGESYEVLEQSEGYYRIITELDNYSGWIDRAMHHEISSDFYIRIHEQEQPVQASMIMSIEHKGQPPVQILAGSTLPGYNRQKDHLEIDGDVYNVRWTFGKFTIKGFDSILDTASHFLNAPYLWGGRSFFGCDCSGFVQVLYKIHGIHINRDADQQVLQGQPVASLPESRTGDLAFFDDSEGIVYHVGLVVAPGEIIHSSGYVHMDSLDEKGIFNRQRQQYSHSLHSIRRFSL